MCLGEMWYLEPSGRVPTFAVGDGDYADAIDVAKRIAAVMEYPFEGGVRNIAKRDGLGIAMLEGVSKIGRLPDHYVQAVGSGTGAIGAWEMGERFVRDGRFGSRLPTLHLGQNLPFAPMLHAWEKGSRTLSPDDLRPELISQITTRVLSTRYPAYSVTGGVFDALTATKGRMYGVENEAVYAGMQEFLETEGIDIVPASGVAVAVLGTAVASGDIAPGDTVLLNITGGGEARMRRDRRTFTVVPRYLSKAITEREIEELLCHAQKKSS
jgi:cysteate synthase